MKTTGTGGSLVTLADGRRLSIYADPDPSGELEVTETLPTGLPGRKVTSSRSKGGS